ncbi:DUF2490 domain-containing protein [Sphingobium yanoikuyae]|uniref:DUF2490 domain-containing protein n=1 Tax=Sphingobium yanoikuyae TaxID=13690 RepID=A0AA43B707_SPHYA|nr:DUF2490 domain-containing protein [Sphingobium yanoikuyae]MDH2130831.1 DUF2490 domain-containing protein [Sphingobium yanoikuyae]MDH2148476.1 DUF2490 domain-containing protein [Sphingobium yanoikuyae]MDH2165000.1 DUF2490 domain-containing protein [Sphingobium yanoikuyae]
MRRLSLCLFVLMALPATAHASEDEQLWTTTSATVKLSDHWRLQQEIVARFSNDRDGLYEIESNTLVGYKLNKQVTVWAGYTHDPQYDGGDFTVMEHRVREQVTVDNILKLGPVSVSARMRMEQRWREGIDGTAWRLRPYVKLTMPFKEGGKTALILSHESFIDLNKTNFQRIQGEERMRNMIAITTPLAKNVNAEIGYLHQHGFRPDADDSNDNVASLSLSFSF